MPNQQEDNLSPGLRVGEWLVRTDLNSMVHESGKSVVIKPKVMDVLIYLCRHAPEVVAKDQLADEVWRAAISDDAITHAVYDLRRVFGDDPKDPKYIQTVAKRGYRLIAPVRTLPATSASEKRGRLRLRPTLIYTSLALTALVLAFYLAGPILRPSTTPTGSPERIESIGVSSFQMLSGYEEDEQISRGFYDSLIASLPRLADLEVFSVESLPAAEAEKLRDRWDAVLEGTVQRSGSQIRVSLRLVDPTSGQVFWGDDRAGPADELFMLQDQVVMAVSSGLGAGLKAGEVRENPRAEAHHAYLRAKRLMDQETRSGFAAAAGSFQEAIRLDPEFSGGYLGLAQCYLLQSAGFGGMEAAVGLEKAREAALKALNLQPDIAEAHAVLATVEASYLRFKTASSQFEQALALNPRASSVQTRYGLFLSAMGRHREALQHTSKALTLEPLSAEVSTAHGRALLLAGEIDRAIEQLLRSSELEPSASAPYYFLYLGYLSRGDDQRALESLIKLYQLQGLTEAGCAAVKEAFALSGVRGAARRELQMMDRGTHPNSHSPVQRARLLAQVGDSDEALDCLEQAYRDQYYFGLVWLKVDPVFDNLRSSPRFQKLVQSIGFPEV